MHITRHGGKRIRERIGVPKKAIMRMAIRAYQEGFCRTDFCGAIREYLDEVYGYQNSEPDIRIYHEHLYLFDGEKLVTAWPLPFKYRRAANRGRRK